MLRTWVVTPNRIQVKTDKPDVDCGEALAKVLSQLPWTPLVALGNNAIYQAPPEDLSRIQVLTALNPTAPDGFEMAQKTVHFAAKRGDTLHNLQVAASKDDIERSSNAQTELSKCKSEFAQDVARKCFED